MTDHQAQPAATPAYEQFTAIRRYIPALAFSPDGSEVAYSVNTSGQYNLWRQSSEGGFPHQVTLSGSQAVREIAWSPDGETIAFTADNDGDEFTKVYTVPARGGRIAEIATKPQVQYGLQGWSPDGRYLGYSGNDRNPTDQDVLLYDGEKDESRRIADYGGIYVPTHWSPDGRRLLIVDIKSNTDIDIYVLDIASEEMTAVTPHDGDIYFVPAGWAADGSGFYLLSNEGREFTGLAFQTLDGTRSWIEPPEWDVEDAAVSADGRWLVWAVNENGYSRLHVRDLTEGTGDRSIDMPDGVLSTMTIAKTGDRLALIWSQPIRSQEVYVVDLASGDVNRITDSFLGGLDTADMTVPELVHYETFDGKQIPAFLFKPKGVEDPMPVVLSIHGGPEAQERPTYVYSGFYQYLASRGIAVLAPNVRGSTGYGKTYQTLIHHDWGGDELKDFRAAAEWLRTQDWVDNDRIGVYGGSFGGFATLSCVSRLPEYWAVGVDLVGPSNLVTFAKAVPPTWRRMMAKWVGDPETEADFLMERSPITYVDQIAAPLFVIQGANDPRVVKPESDQIVDRLRERGVDVRYDVYEDEGHGFTRRENELKAFRDMAGFLEEHLLAD
ncbi:MAG TPA: S9 family peptidase [Thermomicrobiales bacterium]|nr:S9 family peptidase [Thermomicrobiales bacterium]